MRQGSEAAGFGKLLAHELSNKSDRPDASRAESADKNTGMREENAERITAPESIGDGDASVNGGEDVSNPEDAKKSGSASVDSAPPQLMDLANILPGQSTVQPAQLMGRLPAEVISHTHGDHRADKQLIGEAGDVFRRKSTSAEPLVDMPQAEQEGAIPAYMAFVNQSLSLMPGNIAPASTGARPDSTIVQKGASKFAGISAHLTVGLTTDVAAGVAAGLPSGVMAGVQDEAASAGRSTALQNTVANQFRLDARQDGAMHLERSLTDSSFTSEPTKLASSSGDAPPPNPSAIQAEAGLVGAAIERGLAPTAMAPASSPDHFLPTLEPRLGSAGWDSALGQKIVWMTFQQQQIAELSLNPPDLGPLQIVLSVNNDQASAMFVSHNADVRQALEAALPRLREMMADSGISLGNTTISSDSSQQRALMEGFERRNHSSAHYASDDGGANASDSDRASIARIGAHGLVGLVDTFA
jgi:flagellar hook-length control protein FliK